jgi:MraZ protein
VKTARPTTTTDNGERWFLGDAEGTVDSQRRVAIPSTWRDPEPAANRFVLLPGRHGALQLLPLPMFTTLIQKLRQVSFADPQAALALAHIGSVAADCQADKQGRILLTPKLMAHAGIADRLRLVGAVTHIQLWTPEAWEKQKMEPDRCLDVIKALQERPGPLAETLAGLIGK